MSIFNQHGAIDPYYQRLLNPISSAIRSEFHRLCHENNFTAEEAVICASYLHQSLESAQCEYRLMQGVEYRKQQRKEREEN